MFKFNFFDGKCAVPLLIRIITSLILTALILAGIIISVRNSHYLPVKSKQKTVVFWTLQLGSFDKYINNIIGEYEKENPDIKIKWIDVPYSEGEKRTLVAVLTDNPPDLVNLTPDFSLLLAQKNALYNIEEQDLKEYLPSLMQTLKYNNKYFGIPFYATSAITLYNKDLTKKIKLKELPKTYDELFALSYKNKEAFYLTMINFSENDTLLKLLNKYNINSPQTINSEKSIALFNKFKFLYDNALVPKESITQTHRDALEKYMSGQIAFLVTGGNFLNMVKENAPSVYKNTEILPQLTGETSAFDYSLMNFIVPKKAKNPIEAVKFAKYFTNKQNQLEFAKMTPILPVNKEVLEDEYFCDNSVKFQDRNSYFVYLYSSDKDLETKARMISAHQLNYLQPPLTNIRNKKELNTLSSNYIQDILINNAPVKETLDKFSSDWQKL